MAGSALPRSLVLVCVATLAVVPAVGEERWLLRGLIDAEVWKTDDSSALLSRDEGETAPGGDLQLWFAADLHDRVQTVVVGRLQGGAARGMNGTTSTVEQAYLRTRLGAEGRVFLDVGQLPRQIGNASTRYLSRVNPLVGRPLGYDLNYPLGVRLSGVAGRLDYRLAVVDGPLINEHFLPDPGSAWRPALALGVTPVRGLRIGAYYTGGAYLSEAYRNALEPGDRWRDFEQQVVGLDVHFSRRYVELNGDYSRNAYDVPTYAEPFEGSSGFLEGRYVIRPRWFVAVRLSRNRYVKVRDPYGDTWPAVVSRFDDVEIGGGFRATRDLLVKVAYRETHWERSVYPDGRALTAQLSYGFDVREVIDRRR